MKAIETGSFESLKRPQTSSNIIIGYWSDKGLCLNLIKTIVPKGWIPSKPESIAVARSKEIRVPFSNIVSYFSFPLNSITNTIFHARNTVSPSMN